MAKQTSTTRTGGAARPVKKTVGTTRRAAVVHPKVTFSIPWTSRNLIILGIGIAVIVVGYFLMSLAIAPDPTHNDPQWRSPLAVTIAPILLTIGYCVIIPYAIFYRGKRENVDETVA
jgi:hypothetical protein